MARRSIRDLFAKKAHERPALNPEMRSLILSFDAHLQKWSSKADQESQDVGSRRKPGPTAVADGSGGHRDSLDP
jgi:hypothetical protein